MFKLPPEKLGSFYLGGVYDAEENKLTGQTVNYDARDLTTHAVCVGMTGSGKTGLCVGLLEEAAIDKVPALIIDPKGDMTNLMLQFENLAPEEFLPWINADDAGRKGMTPEEYAEKTALQWKEGIGSWGQTEERIRLLQGSVDYTIYTPGSDSGVPVNILGSFAAPGVDFDSDAEMLHERIQGTVAALLGMIDSKEDPVRSREGILLATLFEHHWRKGADLDLAGLIRGIQSPPFSQLGVFDLETFFPEKDRFELAMDFNTLIASPKFSYWLKGDPLDIDTLYFTKDGKPRHSIFYLAHLSESERMFFVTLLLNSLITWMRKQSGTTSLRSLLYFDEIFGYFPPTANPPSKKPLLTILKQARAFGVGAVLVTQNPVDLDYKGLSNAGTWFIGKLQTERDKMRVLEGLEGAIAEAGNNNKTDYSRLISSLSSRVFLLHNVHEDGPVLFHTRWVMSYLRGPLTRPQVKTLMAGKANVPVTQKSRQPDDPVPAVRKITPERTASSMPPSLDPGIVQRFFRAELSSATLSRDINEAGEARLLYEPRVLASSRVRFYDSKRRIDRLDSFEWLLEPPDNFGRIDWSEAVSVPDWESKVEGQPVNPREVIVEYADLPGSLNEASDMKAIEKELDDYLYRNMKFTVLEHEKLDLCQRQDESEEAFRMRVNHKVREERDAELDKLKESYAAKKERIDERIRKETQDLEEAEAEVQDRRNQELINAAETLFSVFVRGRKRSFGSAASKRRMSRRANQKVAESREDLEEYYEDRKALEEELAGKLDTVIEEWESLADMISEKKITPRRADVQIENIILVWYPFWIGNSGEKKPAVAL